MLDFLVSASETELLSDLLWSLGVVAVEEREATDGFVTLRTSLGDDHSFTRELVTSKFPNVIVSTTQVERSVADTWRAHAVPTWVNEDVVLCTPSGWEITRQQFWHYDLALRIVI